MSGTFTLTDNTYLATSITVSGTLTIDLNGFVLMPKDGAAHVIDVPGGATLIIKDSNPTLGHEGYIDDNGLFRWPYNSASGKPKVIVRGGIICNLYSNNTTNRKGLSVNGTCTMQGGKIMGCFAPGIGSAVTVSSGGTFKMTDGEISYNYSKNDTGGNAGAIYGEPSHNNNGSRINLKNTTVSHNKSDGRGGAICAYHVILDNCNISNNQSSTHGGAIWVRKSTDSKTEGTLNITNSTISHNTSNDLGGAIYIDDTTPCTISNSTISHNTATNSGGAINTTGALTITGSTISYNSGVNGGGIRVSGTCLIDDSILEYNYASTTGGGIYSTGPTTITDSFIRNNWAMSTETGTPLVNKGRGGGFCFAGNSTKDEANAIEFILDNTQVYDNASMYYGGGGQLQSSGKLTIQNNTKINKNTCVLDGAAGLHLTGGVFFYMQETCEISENTALGGVGGGIHSSYECFIHLNGGKISNNVVYGRGGGVHVNTGGDLVLNGTDITGNMAYDGYDMVTSTVTKGADGKYSWSAPQGNPDKAQLGYGGGLLVNSGSCTMNKGNLSGNYAQTLGGGIGLIMTESSEYAHHVRLTVFTLNSGNVLNNSTDGNGGGVYLMENILNNLSESQKSAYIQLVNGGDWTPKIILNGGNFSGNTAGKNGGGAYQEQETEFIVSSGKSAVISGNKAEMSGGAVYIEKGKFTVNGSANITGNSAVTGNGGAIYLGLGSSTQPSEFIVGNNGTLKLGGTTSSEGNVAGKNGGGVYCAGKFTSNGNASIQHNNALSGAGIYVDGADAKFTATTELANNTASSHGGGLYVSDGNIQFAKNTISHNKSTNGDGGAIYLLNGTFDASGSTTMTGNSATQNGGAVYVKDGSINIIGPSSALTLSGNNAANGGAFYVNNGNIDADEISNATITGNKTTADGGAFYVNNGLIYLCKTELSGNAAEQNGGAIALYNGTFSFKDGSEIKNNTAVKNGGGLYISNASTTSITCVGGSYNSNTAALGGGIYAAGPISLTFAANVEDNSATNGGGLYLADGVDMTFGYIDDKGTASTSDDKEISGLIVRNEATGTGTNGVGGGIYLAKGKLSFAATTNLGIYNNAASYEAADIFASGDNTTINLPYVKGLNLAGFDVPGSELYWVNDYHDGLGRYEDALRNINVNIEDMILVFAGNEITNKLKVLDNVKTCLDLGYDLVFVTFTPVNLANGDNAAIEIYYPDVREYDANGEEIIAVSTPVMYRKLLLTGSTPQTIGLPSGYWYFDTTGWTYAYESNPVFSPTNSTDFTKTLSDNNDPTKKFIQVKRNQDQEITLTFKPIESYQAVVKYSTMHVNKMKPGGSSTH